MFAKLFTERSAINLTIAGFGFIVAFLGLCLFWGNWAFIFNGLISEEKLGQFGDFVGGVVGTLFGLVGVILFYVALQEQRKDLLTNQESTRLQTEALQKQIEEFELQRSELEETRKVFKEQSETLKFQRFENTFFNLLSLHHQIVSGIDEIEERSTVSRSARDRWLKTNNQDTIGHVTITGRDVFKLSYQRYMQRLANEPSKDFLSLYAIEYETVQTDFGHYFRNLYRIIKFIDSARFYGDNSTDFQTQYQYTSMVRAQLSDYELLFIFYNCLSDNGIERFKPLTEKYSLFKNMPKDKVHDPQVLELYSESAYNNVK